MLLGQWREDLFKSLSKVFARARAEAMGEPDMSRNPFRTVMSQLSVSYDEPPALAAEGADLDGMLSPRITGLLQRHQLFVLGLRESLIKLDYDADGGLSATLVTPDEVAYCLSDPKNPDVPVRVEWLRLRVIPTDRRVQGGPEEEWTWEVWDVSDPANPVFSIFDAKRKVDRTATYLEAPGEYPYKRKDGSPIFPWVLYHATIHGGLWDYEDGRELIEGTLRVGVHWTGVSHGMAEASWPQRTGLDVQMPSAQIVGEGDARRFEVTVDPTSVAMFESINGKTGQLSQFEPAMDVEKMARVLSQYERDLAIYAGLSPSDLIATGDAQSGYAIAVSREGLRRAQRKSEPQFRMGDQALLSTSAALLNAYEGASLPEDPEAYSVVYKGVPLSPDEVTALLAKIRAMEEAGLASPIDALLAIEPGLTRKQAFEKIIQIARERAELKAALDAANVEAGATGATDDVQASALNGAQIASLLGIVAAVSEGTLTVDGAVAAILVGFPTIDETEAARIVAGAIVAGAPPVEAEIDPNAEPDPGSGDPTPTQG